MWTYRNNLQINHMFINHKIVTKKIKSDVQNCIKSTGCSVSEGFQRNKALERNIEIVNNLND